jgi:hypothetical protein
VEISVRVHDLGGSRLLVVLDGPEYARRTGLLRTLRRLVDEGSVAPLRVALVTPQGRMGTFTASPR